MQAKILIAYMICFIGTVILLVPGCGPDQSDREIPWTDTGFTGAELSRIFCDSCHLYTSPELLPKDAWEPVLKEQGHYMGIVEAGVNPYAGKGLQEGLYLEVAGVYSPKAWMADTTWGKLRNFYLESAPDTLMLPESKTPEVSKLFEARIETPDLGGFPAVCHLDFDDRNQRLYVGDVNGFFAELNPQFEMTNFTKLTNPVVSTVRLPDQDQLLMLDIGYMDAKDLPGGAVLMTDLSSFAERALLFEELTRPVDLDIVDIDQDGLQDIVICGFGNLVGKLSLFKGNGLGYDEVLISQDPGALKVEVIDLDADGDEDLAVLFAQAKESIRFYFNDHGKLREERVISFHPLTGSTDFELLDFDGDEDLDIIMTHGDNSDGIDLPKPYHGVSLYVNQGGFSFEQAYFYPMPGAYKLRVRDYDLDGDQDIFAISFYPDLFNGLEESLVLLRQESSLEFKAESIPMATKGRWMVMDAGDFDQDGDEDIVIGSYAMGPGNIPDDVLIAWRKRSDHLLFLENKSR